MKTETIIIGAGVAGLACANKLAEAKRDFVIITEDIGGRILRSKNGQVYYGAYFAMKNYHNVNRFLRLGKRISPLNTRFHKGNLHYSAFNWRVVLHFDEFLKIIFVLLEFKKHYEVFKCNCETMEQIDALKKDPYLWKIYNQKASDFIDEMRIGHIAHDYLEQMVHATTFTPSSKINAMLFLLMSLPVIIPTYKFEFLEDKILDPLKKHVVLATVTGIKRDGESYMVSSTQGNFLAKNVVVATPPHVSKKLLNLNKIKDPTSAHMFHIKGVIREKGALVNVFEESDSALALACEEDGTFVFYSRISEPDFDKYFSDYKIIRHKLWDPAFNLAGHELWQCDHGNGRYLIGDHNVCNMEDSFITGVYVANRILGGS